MSFGRSKKTVAPLRGSTFRTGTTGQDVLDRVQSRGIEESDFGSAGLTPALLQELKAKNVSVNDYLTARDQYQTNLTAPDPDPAPATTPPTTTTAPDLASTLANTKDDTTKTTIAKAPFSLSTFLLTQPFKASERTAYVMPWINLAFWLGSFFLLIYLLKRLAKRK